MSLAIAMNNPFNNYAIIAGDGRITSNDVVVKDDHKKLTQLTGHISMFCSGAQDYCEELRQMVSEQVYENTNISELALIVQKASIEVYEQLRVDHSDYLRLHPDFAGLSTVIAYYDKSENQCGMIEYCPSDGFVPHDSRGSVLKVRGLEREKVFATLGTSINPETIIEDVLRTFKYISEINDSVGGTITLHVVSQTGIDAYEWREFQ